MSGPLTRACCVAAVAGCVISSGGTWAQSAAVISGRVVSADPAGAPVPRALVTIGGASLPERRTVVTDENGLFTFAGLPAGRFMVTATKNGYVPSSYGAKRPGRAGTPISVAAGERVSGIVLALGRTAAIGGTIRDSTGQPAEGAMVSAFRVDSAANTPPLASVTTDARGDYRLSGLAPGDYIVVATTPYVVGAMLNWNGVDLRSTEEVDAILSQLQRGVRRGLDAAPAVGGAPQSLRPDYTYAPVFYPGTAVRSAAAKITLGIGDERDGLDFALALARMSRIEGVIIGSDGAPAGSAKISLKGTDASLPPGLRLSTPTPSDSVSPDGRFSITGVEPGQYMLTARDTLFHPVSDERTGYWQITYAIATITVAGDDITDVVLRLQPGVTFTGRVAFDGAAASPAPRPAGVQVRLTATTSSRLAPSAPSTNDAFGADVKADGTFEIDDIPPGVYQVAASAPGAWWLRSAVVKGVDALDVPLEIGQGADVTGAVLTFSDRHADVVGTLRGAGGAAAPEYFVIVFPADRALWQPGSRRVRLTRPATDGSFTVPNLPGGEYLVAAVTDVESGEVDDPAFLQALVPGAITLPLADGERHTVAIQIKGG